MIISTARQLIGRTNRGGDAKSFRARIFEKAARYRDMILDLRETTRKSRKFTRMPVKLPGAIDFKRDLAAVSWLGLPEPPKRIEGFDISNISGTFMVASMVSFNGKPTGTVPTVSHEECHGAGHFACMAETVRRRYSRLKREQRTCELDSDRRRKGVTWDGHSRAAVGAGSFAGHRLGQGVREIFQPGEKPLRLGLDSGALKLLQRVRDESHRFANTYNAELRLKKISRAYWMICRESAAVARRRC